MRAVIDTNVAAYFLLGTERFAGEAGRFMATVSNGMAPAIWEAELVNVVWMAIRTGVLTPEDGPTRLRLAAQLGIESVPTRSLCHGALLRSLTSGVAVYDTFFVELAVQERCPLATFDKALLKAFPDIAARPGALTR
ncbi:MAG: type II toxin-antitoxin system VapC family toxin [Bryobacteraceae bacterium]